MNKILFGVVTLALLSACEQNSATKADNTAKNVRDRDLNTVTPGDQSESAADRSITQEIRRNLMNDSDLSTNAKNIKVITINRVVVLRGPVLNEAERQRIEDLVKRVNGVSSVDNQLEITNK
jgi:osmotically-inducible protein OsmY